ncbi:MAG TPA: hemerythrin family protein [Accumulibacter sp.]|uniref:bacteriohemerythrin n=1 Tax=Accumulibacter sp. TaxID=2053492 RepID=UPI002C74C7E5|nr:hemerythrin family protein [Accumulibacter sp.]HRD87343.1 hemerythrin family protein [Accumulibacter sp.]
MPDHLPTTPARNATMDGEHRIQLELIAALCAAVDAHAGNEEIGLILERLLDFSKAHFLSEELLMRLDSYDEFDDHVEDHAEMLDALAAMLETHRVGGTALLPGQAAKLLAFLVRHIETRDARYARAPRV